MKLRSGRGLVEHFFFYNIEPNFFINKKLCMYVDKLSFKWKESNRCLCT